MKYLLNGTRFAVEFLNEDTQEDSGEEDLILYDDRSSHGRNKQEFKPCVITHGNISSSKFSVGDNVVVDTGAILEVTIEGEVYKLIREEDILALLLVEE